MDRLVLHRAKNHRPGGDWSDDDYDVTCDGKTIGRIYLANPHSKTGYNWFWGIDFFERPAAIAHLPGWDGFAASRVLAMQAFRKAWDARG